MSTSATRNTWAVCKREINGYFVSPVAYVFIIIFLVTCGFFTFMVGRFFDRNEAALFSFFMWHPWLYLFLVPAIGMRLWAEERRNGSLELLMTMPITAWQAILGKFLAAWLVIAVALALTFPIVSTVYYLGKPDGGVMLCGYIGSLLVAGTYLAISCMTSAMTRNQVVSFIISVVICMILLLLGWPPMTDMLVRWAPAWFVDGVAAFSVMPGYEALQKGVVDTRSLVYYLSMMFFALFATSVIVRNRQSS